MTMRARTNSGRSLRCVLLGLAVLAPATARADVDAAISASACSCDRGTGRSR